MEIYNGKRLVIVPYSVFSFCQCWVELRAPPMLGRWVTTELIKISSKEWGLYYQGWSVSEWRPHPGSSRWPTEIPLSYKEIQQRLLSWTVENRLPPSMTPVGKERRGTVFQSPCEQRGRDLAGSTLPAFPVCWRLSSWPQPGFFKKQLGCEGWLRACSCTELCSPLSLRPCLGPFLSVKVLIVISVTESHSLSVLLCLHPQFLWMSFHGTPWSAPTEMQLSEINLSHPFLPQAAFAHWWISHCTEKVSN